MEQSATSVSAQDHAFELARWYHELAKMCLNAAEYHVCLGEGFRRITRGWLSSWTFWEMWQRGKGIG